MNEFTKQIRICVCVMCECKWPTLTLNFLTKREMSWESVVDQPLAVT